MVSMRTRRGDDGRVGVAVDAVHLPYLRHLVRIALVDAELVDPQVRVAEGAGGGCRGVVDCPEERVSRGRCSAPDVAQRDVPRAGRRGLDSVRGAVQDAEAVDGSGLAGAADVGVGGDAVGEALLQRGEVDEGGGAGPGDGREAEGVGLEPLHDESEGGGGGGAEGRGEVEPADVAGGGIRDPEFAVGIAGDGC